MKRDFAIDLNANCSYNIRMNIQICSRFQCYLMINPAIYFKLLQNVWGKTHV